jgi:Asp-tRNA(Asn)/Glu-tRNA(Gln) amidotransferase A subunit family amidase
VPVPDYSRGLQMEAARFRLGIPRSPFFENLNPEVTKAVEEAIRVLRKLTKSVTDTKLPQCYGRDDHCWSPPAQNRTGAFTHPAPALDEWR